MELDEVKLNWIELMKKSEREKDEVVCMIGIILECVNVILLLLHRICVRDIL